ncbi:MAG TPA: enoyl-CoA hydratase/isomerase family protein [Ignavibacteriaceae bacterium]|nr:enoyl-CoA hydratase/isomerase family protein [Ignavibacteriaceae bacterium]
MIKYEVVDKIGIIYLDRPDKRNALNPELIIALTKKFKEVSVDPDIKVLVISGSGSAFCAGADLEYLASLKDFSIEENEKDSKKIADMFIALNNVPQPTIAAVNGPAIAGGCGLATVCDFIIADKEKAKFGYSEVKIGFLPAIVSIFLINKIGFNKAKRLLLTANIINSPEALELGLVDYLGENVREDAIIFAKTLIKNSFDSLVFTKQMLNNIYKLDIESAVDYCIKLNVISRTQEDFIKGLSNFIKK